VSITPILFLTLASASGWHDGKAELNGYRLAYPRYGELRKGNAVLVYVSETFSEEARVKANPGRHADSDLFDILKLNLVKHFRTGIYDYELMTSVFATFEPRYGRRAGTPTKLSFSSQEWCGNVFDELLFGPASIRQKRFSYFDGEGDRDLEWKYPEGAVTGDELWILVRSFPRPFLAPGESKKVPYLPVLERVRMLHRPLAWTTAEIKRRADRRPISVPFGRFEAETWTVEVAGGDRYEFDVEAAPPARLLGWRGPDGERAELLGSDRLAYWELHEEGDEKYLRNLGLPAE